MNKLFCLLICCALIRSNTSSDIQELRELAAVSSEHGIRSMSGLSCMGVQQVTASNGTVLRQNSSRGIFRSSSQWMVLTGTIEDSWDNVIAQDGRLRYGVTNIRSSEPRMTDYGFGDKSRDATLFLAESFFPSLTSGSYIRDLPFVKFVQLEGFSATRLVSEDSSQFGKCWAWSLRENPDYPNWEGKIWMRSFSSELSAIGRLIAKVNGSNHSLEVTNFFSASPERDAVIERVVISDQGVKRTFHVRDISREMEALDGFSPKRFHVPVPNDPAWTTVSLWSGAALFAVFAAGFWYVVRRVQR